MRTVTLGAGAMRHPTLAEDEVRPDTIDPRLAEASGLLAEGARLGCDFMCLPELFADPSQGTEMAKFAESEGGPVTSWLSRKAVEHNLAIVATVALRHGDEVANTGVVFDRRGELVGSYPKVHLPPGEREASVPGDGFPVFEVEGVKVGMQICYDLDFPEGCRILAVKGAEVIFWPNMWGGMPEEHTDVIMKARAIENAVCLVSAAYVLAGDGFFRAPKMYGRTCIVDWSGSILGEVGRRCGVTAATVDLDEPLACAHSTRDRFPHRRPHLYGELVDRT